MRIRLAKPVSTTLLAILMLAIAPAAYGLDLTLWDEEQPNIQSVLDEAIARFREKHPNIRVKRSHFKTEDLRTQFQTAGIGGAGADLILAPNDFAGVFSIMRIIQPVEKFARMKRFTDLVTEAITDEKGHSWGIPINQGNHLILFVNKSLLSKAPETMEELEDAGKKLTHAKKKRFGLAFNILEPFWLVPFLGAYGEQPLEGRQPNLDNVAMVKTLALLKRLKFDSKVVPSDCDYSCADTLFVEGKSAMTINGDWAIEKYKRVLKGNLIIAPLPKIGSQWMRPMASGKYLLFNHQLKGERLAAAKTFAEFMTSEETQAFLAKRSFRLPSLKKLITSQTVKDDPILSTSFLAMEHSQPMPMQVEMRAVWDAIRPQLQNVMAGRQTPKTAAKIMQQDATGKIKEMKL